MSGGWYPSGPDDGACRPVEYQLTALPWRSGCQLRPACHHSAMTSKLAGFILVSVGIVFALFSYSSSSINQPFSRALQNGVIQIGSKSEQAQCPPLTRNSFTHTGGMAFGPNGLVDTPERWSWPSLSRVPDECRRQVSLVRPADTPSLGWHPDYIPQDPRYERIVPQVKYAFSTAIILSTVLVLTGTGLIIFGEKRGA